MKKLFLTFIACTILFPAFSQMGGSSLKHINDQLRVLFQKVEKPIPNHPEADVFYDLAGHFSDTKWWNDSTLDTNNLTNYMTIYEEIYNCHYDTNKFEKVEVFYPKSQIYKGDTIPISIIDYQFHKLKDSALFSGDYFVVDDNGFLIDNYKMEYNGVQNGNYYDTSQFAINENSMNDQYWQNIDSSSPYETHNIFIGSVLKKSSYFDSVTFVITPELLKLDSTCLNLLANSDNYIAIDYGDGTGWHAINELDTTYYVTRYHSSGNKTLRGAFFNNGLIDKISAIGGLEVETDYPFTEPDDIWTNIPGLTIGVYDPCNTLNPNLPKKFIILSEGFDPVETATFQKTYDQFIYKTGLADLRNHGYTFLVVNYDNSSLPIEMNAQHLMYLITHLKNNYANSDVAPEEQYVVMGASMGGLVARWALTQMENKTYLFQHDKRKDLLHNTRLYVSMDTPHRGANIPLGLQHFYANGLITGLANAYNTSFNLGKMQQFLYSNAASEMLIYHVGNRYDPNVLSAQTTISAFNSAMPFVQVQMPYNSHAERFAFMSRLEDLNDDYGHPQYCKTFAFSDGLMTGGHQLRVNHKEEMQPGDTYLDYEGTTQITVLGIDIPIIETDFEINVPDNNAGRVYYHQVGQKFWRLGIKWKTLIKPFKIRVFGQTINIGLTAKIPDGFEVIYDYIASRGREEFASNAIPYDCMPGGNVGVHGEKADNLYNKTEADRTIYLFDISANTPKQPNGATTVHLDEYDILDHAFDYTVHTDAFAFTLVPLQSALDYDIDRSNNDELEPDYDIYNNHTTTEKMENTLFDVIMAFKQIDDFPDSLKEVDTVSINRPHVTLNNYRIGPNDTLANGNPVRFMNREIGEDVVYLENWKVNRPINVHADDTLFAGVQLNPYYEYPNQLVSKRFLATSDLYGFTGNNVIFSKEDPLKISPTFNNMPVNLFHKSTHFTDNGVVGSYSTTAWSSYPCGLSNYSASWNFKNSELKPKPVVLENESKIWVYPNPATQHINLIYETNTEKDVLHYQLYSQQGVMILSNKINVIKGENEKQIFIPPLSTGLYYLKCKSNSGNFTSKLVIH